ncbi:MAG: hypothetical protein HRU19_18825 [Pseudobacteriovorax sp.]|nr:hypothetical protein [Pseudobacteriovorax sp.]
MSWWRIFCRLITQWKSSPISLRQQTGLSLVSVLVAAGIMGIIATALASLFNNSFRAQSSLNVRVEISAMRRAMVDRFDCNSSLGNPANADIPLDCNAFTPGPLRDQFGDDISFPGFNTRTSCFNDELRVRLVPGANQINPLTQQPWNPNSRVLRTLFDGLGFCREFFRALPANQPPKSFGGTFQVRVQSNGNRGTCRMANQYTGNCTCPSGFFESQHFDFVTASGPLASPTLCNVWYGDGLPPSLQRCGVVSFLCMPFQ